jgi:outer membrane lipoprotein SlyB
VNGAATIAVDGRARDARPHPTDTETDMTRLARLASLLFAFVLAACASPPPGANVTGTGTVNGISEIRQASSGGGLAGSVGGAVVGGAIGSLFGGGSGQAIATGVGAAVGAGAGGQAGAAAGAVTAWDVSVRFDDGIDRVIRVFQQPALRPGVRVRVQSGTITPL